MRCNLFACKPERAELLERQGKLVRQVHTLETLPGIDLAVLAAIPARLPCGSAAGGWLGRFKQQGLRLGSVLDGAQPVCHVQVDAVYGRRTPCLPARGRDGAERAAARAPQPAAAGQPVPHPVRSRQARNDGRHPEPNLRAARRRHVLGARRTLAGAVGPGCDGAGRGGGSEVGAGDGTGAARELACVFDLLHRGRVVAGAAGGACPRLCQRGGGAQDRADHGRCGQPG